MKRTVLIFFLVILLQSVNVIAEEINNMPTRAEFKEQWKELTPLERKEAIKKFKKEYKIERKKRIAEIETNPPAFEDRHQFGIWSDLWTMNLNNESFFEVSWITVAVFEPITNMGIGTKLSGFTGEIKYEFPLCIYYAPHYTNDWYVFSNTVSKWIARLPFYLYLFQYSSKEDTRTYQRGTPFMEYGIGTYWSSKYTGSIWFFGGRIGTLIRTDTQENKGGFLNIEIGLTFPRFHI